MILDLTIEGLISWEIKSANRNRKKSKREFVS